jgi:predicted ATPase
MEAEAQVLWGWATALSDQTEVGLTALREGIEAVRASGTRTLLHFYHGLLAEAERAASRPDHALQALDLGLALSAEIGDRFFEAELHRLRGELLVALSTTEEEGRRAFEEAINVASDQGAVLFTGRAQNNLDQVLPQASLKARARTR